MELINTCSGILDDYARDGYSLTVRQLYYQLVARDLIENTQRSYSRIGQVINNARMAGLLDWNLIVDRGRKTETLGHWTTPRDILHSCVQSFRIDRWEHQPVHIEVMCEKQALEGVLNPACEKWDIPFTSNKGYSSASFMYAKGFEWRSILNYERRDVYVLYFGDHDPSGLDMDRDIEERLSLFSHETPDDDEGTLHVERLALTMDQIDEHAPPPNPTKITDSRAEGYIEKFGHESWELDALEPRTLVGVLDDKVNELLDSDGSRDVWAKTVQLQKEMRTELAVLRDGVDTDRWKERLSTLSEPTE